MLHNLSDRINRQVTLRCAIVDYRNRTVHSQAIRIALPARQMRKLLIPIPLCEKGIYTLVLRATEGRHALQQRICRFAVIPHPAPVPAERSFFGSMLACYPGTAADISFLNKIGLKWVRLAGITGGAPVNNGLQGELAYLKRLKQYHIEPFVLINGMGDVKREYLDYVRYWEIINEPDSWWPVDKYIAEVKKDSAQIKAMDPHAVVLACDVCGADSDSDFAYARAFLDGGGGKTCDVIPFHPYSNTRTFGPGLHPLSPEDNQLLAKMMTAQQLAKQNGLRPWIGEIGFMAENSLRYPAATFGNDERAMASYLTRLYLLGRCVPDLERIIWFLMFPDDTSQHLFPVLRSGGYSLLAANNNVTPSMVAYANLASLTDGAEFKRKLTFANENIYGVLQQKGDQDILALWAVKDACSLSIRRTTGLQKISIVGNRSSLTPVNGHLRLDLTDEPYYLVFPSRDAELIQRIETAAITVQDPVKIDDFGLSDDGTLAVVLRNKLTTPLPAEITLESNQQRDSWRVKLVQQGQQRFVLKLTQPVDMPRSQKFMLTVNASGRRMTKAKALSTRRITPDLIAVRATKAPRLDGNLQDWAGAVPIVLDTHDRVSPPDPNVWKGPADLCATGYVLYDDEYLYFACRVKDDVQKNDESVGKIWAGDSIQLGLGNMTFPDAYTEINFGLSSKVGAVNFMNVGANQGTPVAGMKTCIVRHDEQSETVYEVAIPFTALKGILIYPGCDLRFAFIVNDVDTYSRKWIAVKDPSLIGACKDTNLFPVLYLQP